MYKLFILLPLLVISSLAGYSQLIIDNIPTEMAIANPNWNITVSTSSTLDTASFDIDCNGKNDIRVNLYKGAIMVDIPNTVTISILDSALEFLCDTGTLANAHFFSLGDTIQDSAAFDWKTDEICFLGDHGCFMCFLPSLITDKYLAYKKDSIVGWLKISFNLEESGPPTGTITFTISEVLSTCVTTGIDYSRAMHDDFTLFPNPLQNRLLEIKCPKEIESTCIMDLAGRMVYSSANGATLISLPNLDGIYIVVVTDVTGGLYKQKLVVN